jgi:DNA-binding MarR family transcriptional regulator
LTNRQMRVYTRDMSDCYCISLRTAARKVSALYDDALAPAGINIGQLSMLRRIEKSSPLSLTELGHLSDLDRSTVGRNAKVLERMHLVQAVAGEDQREAALTLTAEGTKTLAEAAPLWERAQATIERAMDGGEAARLLTLLKAL